MLLKSMILNSVLILAFSFVATAIPVPQGACILDGIPYAVCPIITYPTVVPPVYPGGYIPAPGAALAGVQGGAGQSIYAGPGQAVAGYVGAPGYSIYAS
ncbi:hypothetical protein SeMB42_g03475 [Synchytrium endobioticum]|uniref:Uncharacterized protein n=1 Tax=Synchytrium endobioticum TaxID=286115 RepID=A0A507D634_9FUNG|nr:hypothetical protein SeMB42_g03476 [Synchytrium endobioticum]TPX47052.1 hypothetical protein SeMB42_g03475 [Synchytrium endobioticum]TPX50288.1 hypothetical protein SeLEV6574_g00984 [Synchytrium endobioticum]